MQDSKTLVNRAEREIAQSANNSTTEAGHSSHRASAPSAELIDAINQAFELFRLNYHNQYFAAFPDIESLNLAKRLWLEGLNQFSPDTLLRGAKKVIQQSDYLPTLHKMIVACEGDNTSHGLPEVHAAYVEACNAPSPKADQNWSHPAVFLAGKASDWYFLANNSERIALPVFAEHYKALCQQVRQGVTLSIPERLALPETIETPLSKDENLERLASLRKALNI